MQQKTHTHNNIGIVDIIMDTIVIAWYFETHCNVHNVIIAIIAQLWYYNWFES